MAQTNTDDDSARAQGRGDEEPLLGRVGDVSQKDGKGLQYNLVLGTYILFLPLVIHDYFPLPFPFPNAAS